MVCSRCQKKLQKTSLATPDVKRKSDLYLSGSGFGNVGGAAAKEKEKAKKASGPTGSGVSKNKLLSASAKKPYAAYASSFCPICGKSLAADAKGKKNAPIVQGQKFNAK
ncbi:hypothetical protein KEM56_006852 [Ascosphaera pollenicola]|nr:hypothetical protein KEM56_006852 [Ascosphaera pollenicola]